MSNTYQNPPTKKFEILAESFTGKDVMYNSQENGFPVGRVDAVVSINGVPHFWVHSGATGELLLWESDNCALRFSSISRGVQAHRLGWIDNEGNAT